MFSRQLHAVGCAVRVETDAPELEGPLTALLACYAAGEAPFALRYRLSAAGEARAQLWRNERRVYASDHNLDLVAAFELDLYRSLVASQPEPWAIQAAAVEHEGWAVALVGNSGAGKSSLALALVAGGARYVTDEFLVVNANGSVVGIPRPISFAPEDDPPAQPADFRRGAYAIRRRDGQWQEMTLLAPPAARLCRQPVPLAALLLLRRDGTSPARLETLSSGEALVELWRCSLRSDESALPVATRVAGATPVMILQSASLAEAAEVVTALLSRGPPASAARRG